MARTAGERGASGISAFVLEPKKMKGITFGRHERKMGWRGAPNTPIFLDNVRVPVENLVGEEGKGFRASLRALDLNRPTIGAQCVGLAQGALDASVAYAKERKQFKQPIADFQGVQFMLADMAMGIEASRALVYECARAGDAGDWDRLNVLASMAKCVASDMAMKVDHRRGADLRRLRLHQGLPGRTNDARRQARADLRRHQPDPAGGGRPPPAAADSKETPRDNPPFDVTRRALTLAAAPRRCRRPLGAARAGLPRQADPAASSPTPPAAPPTTWRACSRSRCRRRSASR